MNILKKRSIVVAISISVVIAVVLAASRSQAGFDGSRCTWNGLWDASWDSSTGRYSSQVNINSGSWGINGTYNNGKFEGLYVLNNPNVASGIWRRTKGHSGGRCQYGGFYFTLSPTPISNKCKIYGNWDYCGSGSGPNWQWNLEHSL